MQFKWKYHRPLVGKLQNINYFKTVVAVNFYKGTLYSKLYFRIFLLNRTPLFFGDNFTVNNFVCEEEIPSTQSIVINLHYV